MKYASIKHLACALAAALAFPIAALAATPVAVWDGNFNTVQPGYTLNLNGNQLSQDNSTITINQNVGVTVVADGTFTNGFTVLFRYSNLDISLADKQVLATSILTDANDRTGVSINTSGKSCGIWDGNSWNTTGTFNSMTASQTSGTLAFSHYSTTTYSGTGTKLFYVGSSSATTILDAGGLGSKDDTTKYKGFAIGGRSAAASGFSAAAGMKISGIAIFDGILNQPKMISYMWPSDTITEYTLTLDGTPTNWSGGSWKVDAVSAPAPVDGYAKIVFSNSTTLTIDTTVALKQLVLEGSDDAVLTLVAGSGGSFVAYDSVKIKRGVLKQGSAAVLGATPAVAVEDGATFDMNGLAVSESNVFSIEGDGAGSWPWALTSSGGASDIVKTITLTGDATIGGANQIKLGKTQVGNDLTLNGHTLAKTGSGELYCTNLRFFGGGTLDLQGGTASFNQWTSLDGSETIDRHTTVIVREGTTIANNAGRRLWIDTLDVRGGTVTTTANGYFGVSSVLTGACNTVHLQLNNGAIAALSGNLTTETMECGSASFNKVNGVAPVTVTPGILTASGAISVGAGVTFNLGTNRPTATFAVNDNATISIQKAAADDVPTIKVSAQPASVVLYDENGNRAAAPTIQYDSASGVVALVYGTVWAGDSGTWTSEQFDGRLVDTEDRDVFFAQGVPLQSAVTVTVDGAQSVKSISFTASDTAYTLTGDKITTTEGLLVSGTAPVAISNAVDGTVAVNANSTLTLAGENAVLQSGKLSGAGMLVLDPGEGNTYTMSTANTSYTGEAVIKSGTVKMGNHTSFGEVTRSASIRVKGGATLDENLADCISSYYAYDGHSHKVILEEGAIFTSSTDNLYNGKPDDKYAPVSIVTLEGDAYVVADVADAAISIAYNYDYTHIYLNNHTLTKTGSHDFSVSCVVISGAGTIDVQEGSMTVCNNYEKDVNPAFSGGTLKLANGATLKLSAYNGGHPAFTVKNLELTGSIYRDNAASTLTVTGYITGNGTTPMLTLAEGAKLKPSGNGYLRITESLTLPNDTLTVDISGIDFTAGKSIPLFKVGPAAALPDIKNVTWTGNTLPDGWVLAKTADGLGYRIRNLNRQLRLILR